MTESPQQSVSGGPLPIDVTSITPRVNRIAIAGAASPVSRSLAERLAAGGVEIVWTDPEQSRIEEAMHRIAESLQRRVARGEVNASAPDEILGRIRIVSALDLSEGPDLVIDAAPLRVTEDEQIRTLEELNLAVEGDTPILTTIHHSSHAAWHAQMTERFSRALGLHIPLARFEVLFAQFIVPANASVTATILAREALLRAGLRPMETPPARRGLLLERFLLPAINQACRFLRVGDADVETIDRAFPIPWLLHLGPCQSADLMGLERIVAMGEQLAEATDDERYRTDPLLRALVKEGSMGWKTGCGFYEYGETS